MNRWDRIKGKDGRYVAPGGGVSGGAGLGRQGGAGASLPELQRT